MSHKIVYKVKSWSIDATPYNYPKETRNELGHTTMPVIK